MHNYARAGVVGATGYAGRELVGLLARHPRVRLDFGTARSERGVSLRTVSSWAPDLPLVDAEEADLGVDVVFLCVPHGCALGWAERARAAGARVVDLSSDLRVPAESLPAWACGAAYGLPELFRDAGRGAPLIANPGCYPTATLLGLMPLVRRGLVAAGPVVVNAASGVSGAGRTPKRELLYAEVAGDYRAYGVGNTHRHLSEMVHHAGDGRPEIVFTPHLLPVKRGILATLYVPLTERVADPALLFAEEYAGEPFVRVLREGTPSLSDVVGTNRAVVGAVAVSSSSPAAQVVVAIDNLLKGAAGQAVQNMNLSFGWDESEGLPC